MSLFDKDLHVGEPPVSPWSVTFYALFLVLMVLAGVVCVVGLVVIATFR